MPNRRRVGNLHQSVRDCLPSERWSWRSLSENSLVCFTSQILKAVSRGQQECQRCPFSLLPVHHSGGQALLAENERPLRQTCPLWNRLGEPGGRSGNYVLFWNDNDLSKKGQGECQELSVGKKKNPAEVDSGGGTPPNPLNGAGASPAFVRTPPLPCPLHSTPGLLAGYSRSQKGNPCRLALTGPPRFC